MECIVVIPNVMASLLPGDGLPRERSDSGLGSMEKAGVWRGSHAFLGAGPRWREGFSGGLPGLRPSHGHVTYPPSEGPVAGKD
jgi:hypothetical protein